MATLSDLLTKNFKLDEQVHIMENKVQILVARASDICSELDVADIQIGKKRRREVELWLEHVRVKKDEIHEIVKEVKKRRILLPNLQLKNRIGRLYTEVEELLHQGKFPNGLVLNDVTSTRVALLTPKLVDQMFEQKIEMIWAWIKDVEVQKIGIYGMGGVGKSCLMMCIHNRLLDQRDLGDVYWVTVTQGSTKELQNKIAKAVGLYLPNEEDLRRRAAILSSILSRIGKIVLILDDLWMQSDLDEVGVPHVSANCKVIVTSRSLDVCRRMSCQRFLKVEPLPEEESWQLFLENIGDYKALSGESMEIARMIAKQCGGLPLGLRTIARSMNGVLGVSEWENALQELRNPVRVQDEMENEVFTVLKFSYNHLNDVRLQSFYLNCALYPEDYRIQRDELADLFIAEGALDEIESRHEQVQKAHSILNRLVNSCLLEAGEKYVKMHDLMRGMAISITKKSPKFMAFAGAELSELPKEQYWPDDVEKASFFHNRISEIPPEVSPKCPKLSTLILQCNPLERISNAFFLHMKGLEVLNLSFTNLEKLPESVSQLENLTALLLNGCWKLTYVPSLTKLKKLRELNFRHTRIKEAPEGLDGLTNLRTLDLSQIKDLSRTFIRILPRICSLQVLKLNQVMKGKDLMALRYLEKLQCRTVFNMPDWNKFIESRHHWKLKYYLFLIRGTTWRTTDNYVASWHNNLLSGSDRIIIISESSFDRGNEAKLPQDIQFLGIHDCNLRERGLIENLPVLHNATELRVCEIKNCEGIEYIWSPKPPVTTPQSTFSHFRKLHIYSCPRLKKLFPSSLLEQNLLPNLQEIKLVKCPEMTEILAANEDQGNTAVSSEILSLPNLKLLSLSNLPKMESICRGLLICTSLMKVSTENCPLLKMIPLSLPLLCDRSVYTLQCLPTDIEWWTLLDRNYPKDVKILRRALIKQSFLTNVL